MSGPTTFVKMTKKLETAEALALAMIDDYQRGAEQMRERAAAEVMRIDQIIYAGPPITTAEQLADVVADILELKALAIRDLPWEGPPRPAVQAGERK